MANVSKSNLPRRSPGMTRNGRIRLRSLGVKQLEALYNKSSDKKSKGKILNELNRQRSISGPKRRVFHVDIGDMPIKVAKVELGGIVNELKNKK